MFANKYHINRTKKLLKMHLDCCMCKTHTCFSLEIYIYICLTFSLQKIRLWSVRRSLSVREHTFHFALKVKLFLESCQCYLNTAILHPTFFFFFLFFNHSPKEAAEINTTESHGGRQNKRFKKAS